MDLLFGKTPGNEQAELKLSLGFIDADISFNKIKPDLRTATSKLIEVIGKPTYEGIVAEYKKPTPTELDLIELAQYAVATAAYRLYAPANDLQHGNNGRKMLTDEHSKTPFEHMIVASNDDIEKRSFRALDELIKYMDADYVLWKASAQYKASHKLFVRTTAEYDLHYVMNSRLLLIKLQPGMALAEKREILPRITREVFDVLKAKRNGTNTTPLTETEQVLLPLIQEACVYSSLSWGIPRLQATLFPEGILQSIRSDRATIKGRTAFQGNQVDQLSQLFKEDSARVLMEIEKVLKPEEVVVVDPNAVPEEPFGFSEDDNFVST